MASSRNIKNDTLATSEMCNIWRKMLNENISIFCHEGGKSEMVAINILGICSKDDDNTSFQVKSKDLSDMFMVMKYAEEKFNVFNYYGVEKYVTDFGLSVQQNFRKKGIATEMLKVRITLMQLLDINLTSTVFTGLGAQIAAKKIGFEENFSIT